jgi:hypothetical protein
VPRTCALAQARGSSSRVETLASSFLQAAARVHPLRRALALGFCAVRLCTVGLCAASAVAGAGCGPAGGGSSGDFDPDSPIRPTPSGGLDGNGSRIHEVVGPATWLNPADTESAACAVPADRPVRITGMVLTAIDRFDETGDGAFGNYYAQDSEQVPYSGMTIFDPGFSPPDLALVPGDRIDFSGTLLEFLGPSTGRFGGCKTLPEIAGALSLRFDGDPPAAAVVTLNDLTTYQDGDRGARQWLGRLVRLEGVEISGAPQASGGRYTANIAVGSGVPFSDVPKISNELYDLEAEGPPLASGATFSSVTGVLTYFSGFKIAPRSPADFEP